MGAANTQTSYGWVSRALHWLTFALLLVIIPLGVIANGMPEGGENSRATLFSLHKALGLTLFFLALLRIGWMLSQPKPVPLHPAQTRAIWAEETVHWLLYGSLVLVPLAGWIHHAATPGAPPILGPFGQSLPFVPTSQAVSTVFAGLHVVLERVLVFALLLHIAAALKHHFIDRDQTMRRMTLGTSAGTPAARKFSSLPFVTSLTVWAIAIGLGGALGAYSEGPPVAADVPAQRVTTD